jgi:type IV secretion system protein TrbI
MRSDLPGEVTVQVTENVYDSPTGRHLGITQRSTSRPMKPCGSAPGWRSSTTDRPFGMISRVQVDQHWDRLVMGASLSTVIRVGAELGSKRRRVSAAAR